MPASGGTLGGAANIGPLSRYVRNYLDRTGESERGLARRSRDPISEVTVRHGWLNELLNGTIERAPELRRLRALAVGMGVPVRTLAALAAKQWLEVDVVAAEGDDTVETITVPAGLTPEQRAKFRRMVEDMARHI